MRGKSRHIPLDKYLECLSIEWMGAMVCSRILSSDKDKAYWRRVMAAKELKIKDISDRNVLKSIFNDRETYRRYHATRSESGFPIYLQEKYINAYYKKGRSVTFIVNGKENSGTLVSISMETGYCTIDHNRGTAYIHVSGVTVIV